MDRRFQTQRLYELVYGEWMTRSISVHNRVTDIRCLVAVLGGVFLQLDPILVEIETISGVALGMGDEDLDEGDIAVLSEQIFHLKKQLSSICKLYEDNPDYP